MRSFVRPVVYAAVIALLASCSDSTAPRNVVDAQSLWQSQNISSYSYVAERVCFCLGGSEPVTVQVVQGKVSSVTVVATGAQIPTSGWPTINELFDEIIANPPTTVQFNAALGYTTRIERCCLEDDSGSRFTVSDLQIIA
jgi:hypothetical protein